MKEVTLKLVDEIADYISSNAKELGLTSEELVKFIVGSYVQDEKRHARRSTPRAIVGIDIDNLMEGMKGDMDKVAKELFKKRIREGDLSCKNCTMKLTEQAIDDGKCNSCGAPLKDALGGKDV